MATTFDRVEDAISAIAAGELVVVVDDDDRENEGDLIIMVFEKPDRIATVEIFKGSRFGAETDVTISVVPRMLMGN